MKLKVFFVLWVLMLSIPVLAQDSTNHSITFDELSFQYDASLGENVNVLQVAGDPVADAGPGFSDAAKTQFTFYDFGEPMDSLFDTGGMRVYATADLAQYDFLQTQVDALQSLLAERPDLTEYETAISGAESKTLPYVPVLTHGQNLTARGQYVETDAVSGVAYVTAFRAAQEPFLPTDFLYTFQGISADGQWYINVTFPLYTELFPETLEGLDMEQFNAQWPEYLAESLATLNAATPEDFTPSLSAVDALIRSVQFAAN